MDVVKFQNGLLCYELHVTLKKTAIKSILLQILSHLEPTGTDNMFNLHMLSVCQWPHRPKVPLHPFFSKKQCWDSCLRMQKGHLDPKVLNLWFEEA